MTYEQARVGVRVRTLVDWPEVPTGTEGVIVEDYETGVTVRWEIYGRQSYLPLKDGFSKQDLRFLELHPKYAAEALNQAITNHDLGASLSKLDWPDRRPS